MKNTLKFTITAALLAVSPLASAGQADCVKLSNAVKVAVAADSAKLLEIVVANISANESCACEIVKAAIVASDANDKVVAKIVNAAILEAPSQARVIAQCAIATSPSSTAAVQSVLEKYDAAGGEGYSEKGGLSDDKDPIVLPAPPSGFNPLDRPFDDIYSPTQTTNGFGPNDFSRNPLGDDPILGRGDDNVTEVN